MTQRFISANQMETIREKIAQNTIPYDFEFFDALFIDLTQDEIKQLHEMLNTRFKPKVFYFVDTDFYGDKNVDILASFQKILGNQMCKLEAAEDKRVLQIAYVSFGFKDHTTTHLVKGVIREHDKTRFHVTCICSDESQMFSPEDEVFRTELRTNSSDFLILDKVQIYAIYFISNPLL